MTKAVHGPWRNTERDAIADTVRVGFCSGEDAMARDNLSDAMLPSFVWIERDRPVSFESVPEPGF